MTKAQAKREACWLSSLVLENTLDNWETLDRYPDDDRLRIEAGMRELIEELHRRGWVKS